jgi:hypothetical protein
MKIVLGLLFINERGTISVCPYHVDPVVLS